MKSNYIIIKLVVMVIIFFSSSNYLICQHSSSSSKPKLNHVNMRVDTTKNIIKKHHAIDLIASELNLSTDVELRQWDKNHIKKSNTNLTHRAYKQFYGGIEIESSAIRLHFVDENLVSFNGSIIESIHMNTTPQLSEQEAMQKALDFINAESYIWQTPAMDSLPVMLGKLKGLPEGKLVISKDKLIDRDSLKLAYKFDIYAIQPISRDYVYVDAVNGSIINIKPIRQSLNGTATTRYYGQKTIQTMIFQGNYILKDESRGDGVWTLNIDNEEYPAPVSEFTDNDNNWTTAEHSTNKDNAALDAHWSLIQTYDYFDEIHSRDSWDDNGSVLVAYAHYGEDLNTSYWNDEWMELGDGDGTDWDPLTTLDIVAHEFGHGVLESEVTLDNEKNYQSIKESLSDIWGVCVESYVFPTSEVDIWTTGEEADLRSGKSGLRSLMDPNSENQPASVDDDLYEDVSNCTGSSNNLWCYGQLNCGVMNHWFYILCTGDYPDLSITPLGIETAAEILYLAETEYFLETTTTFEDARDCIIEAAEDMTGDICSEEVISVTNAWYAVGVGSAFTPYVYDLEDENITSDRSVTYCSFEVDDVTVSSSSTLTLDYEYDVLIFTDFIIYSQSELLIY